MNRKAATAVVTRTADTPKEIDDIVRRLSVP